MNVAHIDRHPMVWRLFPWRSRVRQTQERTSRVAAETSKAERDLAEKVARATLVSNRVEQAALQVLRDHEAVMMVAARERKEGAR